MRLEEKQEPSRQRLGKGTQQTLLNVRLVRKTPGSSGRFRY
jgi:hypothetical protein